ncbi:MAG: hypothetical protein RIQ33_671 [Bacteroidota bacterium]|jgi:hypothetical protein
MKKLGIFIGLFLIFNISFSQTIFNLPKPNRVDIVQQNGLSSMISSLFTITSVPKNCEAKWLIKGGYPSEATGDSIAPIFHTWPWVMSVYYQRIDSPEYRSDTTRISLIKKNSNLNLFIEGADSIEAGKLYTFSAQQKMDAYQWFIQPSVGVIISGQNTSTIRVFFHASQNEKNNLIQLTAYKEGVKYVVSKKIIQPEIPELKIIKKGGVSVGDIIQLELESANLNYFSGKVVYHWGDGMMESCEKLTKTKRHVYTTSGKKKVSVYVFNQNTNHQLVILNDSFDIYSNNDFVDVNSIADFKVDYYCVPSQRLSHVLLFPQYSKIENCKKVKWEISSANIMIDTALYPDLYLSSGNYKITLTVETKDGKRYSSSQEIETKLAPQVSVSRLDSNKIACELTPYHYKAKANSSNENTINYDWSMMNSSQQNSLRKNYSDEIYATDFGGSILQSGVISVTLTDQYGCSTKSGVQQLFYPNELENDNIITHRISTPPIYFGDTCKFKIATIKPMKNLAYTILGNENISVSNSLIPITKSGAFIIKVKDEHGCIGYSNTISSYFEERK